MNLVTEMIIGSVWGITSPALEGLLRIADREPDIRSRASELSEVFHKSMLSAPLLGDKISGARYSSVRDGVGILSIFGPLFPRANMMTEMSGATSSQVLGSEFSALLSNPDIKSILLNIDSPGGAITGTSELSSLIYNSRNVKRVWAFISGAGASASYWIGSSASRVIIADTGEAGSIGTVAIYRDTSKQDEQTGIRNIEIVSSQSPLKRVSPSTDIGREKIQRMVDSATTVFIRAVAKQRGTDEETVAEDFGRGDMFLGIRAVAQGLADDVGTFESVIATLAEEDKQKTKNRKGIQMPKENEEQSLEQSTIVTYSIEGVKEGSPETFEAIKALGRKEGAEAERNRIQGIQALNIPGSEKIIASAVSNPEMTAEKVALEIVKAQQQRVATATTTTETEARALADQVAALATATATEKTAQQEAEEARIKNASEMAKGANAKRVSVK